MIEGLERHKILGLDGDGWVTDMSRGQDLLWAMRAQQPDDDFDGAAGVSGRVSILRSREFP